MADPKKSVYARLASRFAHLALGAKEEEEEDKDANAEEESDDEEAKEEERAEKPKAKKAKKGGKDCPTSEEDEDDKEAAEDEDDDEKEDEKKKAVASERGRWTAVLSSSEAKGRVPLACSLLADTNMSSEKIRAALLASPVEGRQGLAARMATVVRPEVGSAPSGAPDPGTPKGRASEIVNAYNKAVGAPR